MRAKRAAKQRGAGRPAFDDVTAGRRRNMRAVRSKNTAAEMRVRHLLHAMGYRYRLHVRDMPGRPDIVLSARRKVVEVRGCFWHRHPDPTCRNAVLPQTRRDWWAEKLAANVARDTRNLDALLNAGWEVLVVWECETFDQIPLKGKLEAFLGPPKLSSTYRRSSKDHTYWQAKSTP